MVSVFVSGLGSPVWGPGWKLCCVVGQDTSLSQCLSPRKCITGTGKFKVSALAKIEELFYSLFTLLVFLSTPILLKHGFWDKTRAQQRERWS